MQDILYTNTNKNLAGLSKLAASECGAYQPGFLHTCVVGPGFKL